VNCDGAPMGKFSSGFGSFPFVSNGGLDVHGDFKTDDDGIDTMGG